MIFEITLSGFKDFNAFLKETKGMIASRTKQFSNLVRLMIMIYMQNVVFALRRSFANGAFVILSEHHLVKLFRRDSILETESGSTTSESALFGAVVFLGPSLTIRFMVRRLFSSTPLSGAASFTSISKAIWSRTMLVKTLSGFHFFTAYAMRFHDLILPSRSIPQVGAI